MLVKSIKSSIFEVFSNRNIMAISVTHALWSFFNALWRSFWVLYVLELGATIEIFGLMLLVQNSSRLLLHFMGGALADKFSRRKIIIYGTSLRILTPIVYLIARSWIQLIPGAILATMSSIYMPAFYTLIAEALPKDRRGASFGAYRMLTYLPTIFASLLGGIIMDWMGIVEGVKLLLIFTIAISPLSLIGRAKLISEPREKSENKSPETREAFFELRLLKGLEALLIISCLSNFALRLIIDFLAAYAVNIVGLTATKWGLIETVTRLISTLLAMPGGILSDRIGRKPCIMVERITAPITTLGLTFSRSFNQVMVVRTIYGVGEGLGSGGRGFGGVFGGPAWQALMSDLVPSSRRGRVIGIIGTITGFVSLPSPWLGGYLWDNYHPDITLWTSFLLGMIASLTFYLFVKEPKVREK